MKSKNLGDYYQLWDDDKMMCVIKRWATKTDGFDGAIGNIIDNFPCPFDEDVMLYESYCDELSDKIPACPEFDLDKILAPKTFSDEGCKLHYYSADLTLELHSFYKTLCNRYVKKLEELENEEKEYDVKLTFPFTLHTTIKAKDCSEAKRIALDIDSVKTAINSFGTPDITIVRN